jgi:hypothetical protein
LILVMRSVVRLAAVSAVWSLALGLSVWTDVEAQQRRRKPAPKVRIEPAKVKCPEELGTGARTGRHYCFVLAGRDPAEGVVVTIPRHTGPATLLFELHNRHTYSEEEVKAGRGYASYLAIIGVLTMKGDLLSRGAVQSEFRHASDLLERITGGAGPSGLRAVAPIGREQVIVTIPAAVTEVSLLGEVLDATTSAGREVATPGRPVALVSNIRVEYRPR